MSFVEIMVFHVMVRNKVIYIIEYHDMAQTDSGTISACAVPLVRHLCGAAPDGGICQRRAKSLASRQKKSRRDTGGLHGNRRNAA
jgi:hypothetical protein